MKTRLLLVLVGLVIGFTWPTFAQQKEATPSGSTPEVKPPPTLGDHFTQVLPDRRVTFRLFAPKANAVEVVIGIKSATYEPQGTTVAEMTKDPRGLWAVTLGPLDPNVYTYQFRLDGCGIADPSNDMPLPLRHIDASLLMIPGTPPDFLDDQTGAHGTMHDEMYYSTTLGKNRNVLVYTPPSYDRSRAPLPVLYLYSGFFATRYLWATEGRLPQILDNLLTQGKAVPMIVVLPDPHALAYETTPLTNPDFFTNFFPFFLKNQTTADEELFRDIIPFIQAHYNISNEPRERAIAGLSMGGLQALGTGIGHLGYFSWLGAFSPTPPSVLGDDFRNALKDPNKINENLRLFEIVTGDSDAMTGPSTRKFEIELQALKIQHVYTVVPGTHSMFVWRPALANFLQEIFKNRLEAITQPPAAPAQTNTAPTSGQEKSMVDPQVRQQIETIFTKVQEAYNSRDSAAIAAILTADAIQVRSWPANQNGGTHSGRQPIEKMFETDFAGNPGKMVNKIVALYPIGSAVCEIADSDVGGWKAQEVTIYVREGDTWKARITYLNNGQQIRVDPQVRQQIEALFTKFQEAFNNRDLATIAALHTQDAIEVRSWPENQNGGTHSGWKPIEKMFETDFATNPGKMVNKLVALYPIGSAICEIADSDVGEWKNQTVTIYVRDGDTWKAHMGYVNNEKVTR